MSWPLVSSSLGCRAHSWAECRLWGWWFPGLGWAGKSWAGSRWAHRAEECGKVGGSCHSRLAPVTRLCVGRCWAGRLHICRICQRSRWWWQDQWGRCSSREHSKPWCQELGFCWVDERSLLVSRCFCLLHWLLYTHLPGRQPITEIFPPCFSL